MPSFDVNVEPIYNCNDEDDVDVFEDDMHGTSILILPPNAQL